MFQVGDIVQVIIVPKKYKQYDIAGATGVVKTVYSNNIRIHISKEEEEKIKEWQLKHDAEKHGLKTMEQRLRAGGCCGGRYTYQFVPTSIGTIGEVICSCGEKFTFQDL